MAKRIASPADLRLLHQRAKAKLARQEAKTQIKVHLGSCGIASGANRVLETFTQEVATRELPSTVVLKAACIGLCDIEPVVTVLVPGRDKVIYTQVTPEKANLIVATGHNNLAMNRAVYDVARAFIKNGHVTEGMLNRVEVAIRCYDPCFSCSTHALGKMPLEAVICGPDGAVRQVIRN
jgi:(2Fe-2S) ferredoxin